MWQVMGGTCGKWLQWFTLALTVLNLMGNGTAQIVAGAANTYFINPVLTKRCAPLFMRFWIFGCTKDLGTHFNILAISLCGRKCVCIGGQDSVLQRV